MSAPVLAGDDLAAGARGSRPEPDRATLGVVAALRHVAEEAEATIETAIPRGRPAVEARVALLPLVEAGPHEGASRPEGRSGSAVTFAASIRPSPRRVPTSSASAR
jgi:hypothetical protein